MPSAWLTEQGLFSVQSGWSMLSARVRPWLFDDSEGYKRIRRLLLDLARVLQKSQKVCKIIIDLEPLQKTLKITSYLVGEASKLQT